MEKTFLKNKLEIKYLDVYLMIGIYLLSIFIPVLGLPQLLTGSIINFLIIYSSVKFGFKKSIPVFIFPSIIAFFNGMLFGSANIFLAYFVVPIILSNSIYSLSFSNFKNKWIGVLVSSVLKASALFLTALLFVKVLHIPTLFLKTMGIYQLFTALAGGIIAVVVSRRN